MRLFRAARNRYFGEVTGDWLAARNRLAHSCWERMIATISSSTRMVSGAPSILVLLVTEPAGGPGALAGAGAGRADREQRVAVEQADLADPPPGAGQQHQDAHRLLVAQPALGSRRAPFLVASPKLAACTMSGAH